MLRGTEEFAGYVEEQERMLSEADDAVAAEPGRKPSERILTLVDHRDGVPLLLQDAGELAPDSTASHHDHVHGLAPLPTDGLAES